MKDQHKKIKGYRDLCQSEVDLMNEIKEHFEKTGELIEKIKDLRDRQSGTLRSNGDCVLADTAGLDVYQIIESKKLIDIAVTNLRQGNMWLVRAIALPDTKL